MIFPAINLHLYIGGFPLRRLMRPDGISVIALASISVSISGGSFRTQWRQPICRCESDSNLFYRIIFYLCVYVSLSFQFILDRKPTPKLSSGRITLLTYPRCNWRLEFVFFMRFFQEKTYYISVLFLPVQSTWGVSNPRAGYHVLPTQHFSLLRADFKSISVAGLTIVNGHSRILNWRYLPYIRPIDIVFSCFFLAHHFSAAYLAAPLPGGAVQHRRQSVHDLGLHGPATSGGRH